MDVAYNYNGSNFQIDDTGRVKIAFNSGKIVDLSSKDFCFVFVNTDLTPFVAVGKKQE